MNAKLLVKLPPFAREVAIRKSWFEERDRLIAEAGNVRQIESESGFEKAGAILAALSQSIGKVDSMRAKIANPFLMAAKTLKEAADSAKAPLETARRDLRAKLNAYADAERKRKEAERRRAIEARENAAEDFRRIQRMALDCFGEEAEIFNPPLPPKPPEKPAPFPKARTAAARSRLCCEVRDEALLPRELLSPDKAKIAAWLERNRRSLRERLQDDPAFSPLPGMAFKLVTEVIPR